MSCVGRGHHHQRRLIDGRWYWACVDCPDRLIAAPLIEGSAVAINDGDHAGRRGRVICFYGDGARHADVRLDDGAEVNVVTAALVGLP